MTLFTHFYQTKAGQGMSTAAIVHSLHIADKGLRTLYADMSGNFHTPAILGIADTMHNASPVNVNPTFDVVHLMPETIKVLWSFITRDMPNMTTDYDHVVMDWGTTAPTFNHDLGVPDAHQTVLYTKACYIALRNFVSSYTAKPDAIVMIQEQGRALREVDVAAAVGIPIEHLVTIPHDPQVARCVDAGLLSIRAPRQLRNLDDLNGLKVNQY
jgi:hypothetical protein